MVNRKSHFSPLPSRVASVPPGSSWWDQRHGPAAERRAGSAPSGPLRGAVWTPIYLWHWRRCCTWSVGLRCPRAIGVGEKVEKTKRRKEIRNKKRTRLIQSLWCLLRAVKNMWFINSILAPRCFLLLFFFSCFSTSSQLNLFLCTAGSPDSLTGVDHLIFIHTCFVTIEAPECFQGKWQRQKNYIKT